MHEFMLERSAVPSLRMSQDLDIALEGVMQVQFAEVQVLADKLSVLDDTLTRLMKTNGTMML